MDHILIIGGGASGILTALHLLRDDKTDLRITIIEKRGALGRGVAYDTPHPSHILNMRSGNMSAYADTPDHFLNWLTARGLPSESQGFAQRETYGAYLSHLLAKGMARGQVRWENSECIGLRRVEGNYVAELARGGAVVARAVVLATGHILPRVWEAPFSDPWLAPPPADRDAPVMLLGTGLTMVDRAMRLLEAGHRGRMLLVSRHGLLPQPHARSVPVDYGRADVPLGASAAVAARWLRSQIRLHTARGGDWRDVMDGVRPYMTDWWQSAPPDSRARFLRHGRRYWEVHRHRVPIPVLDRLGIAAEQGQVQMLTGQLENARVENDGIVATIRLRGGARKNFSIAQLSDCRGVLRDPHLHAPPLLSNLIEGGLARIDPLGIGLDVSPSGRLRGTDAPLFAIGPLTRPAFWEASSILDIRVQAARLARALCAPPLELREAR